MSNSILVPVDFTKTAEKALDFASDLASRSSSEVILFHVVETPTIDAMMEGATRDFAMRKMMQLEKLTLADLNEVADANKKKHNIETKVMTRSGVILEAINEAVGESGSWMVVMGTHGIKGPQHITGGNAIKILNNSKVHYLVIQGNTILQPITKVLLLITGNPISEKCLDLLSEFTQKTKAHLHLVDMSIGGNAVAHEVIQARGITFSSSVISIDCKASDLLAIAANENCNAIASFSISAAHPNFNALQEDLVYNDKFLPYFHLVV